MAAPPRISVVIPSYNRPTLLREAIESVERQTVDCWELIVVDDGSTEDVSGAISQYLANPRISYRRQTNAGRCIARNNGAALAQGDFLCFLDCDDAYAPDGLASRLSAVDSDGVIGGAGGGYD